MLWRAHCDCAGRPAWWEVCNRCLLCIILSQVNWYGKDEVRCCGEEGDIVKRSLGETESWETPRAPL